MDKLSTYKLYALALDVSVFSKFAATFKEKMKKAELKIIEKEGKKLILDVVRKKYLVLTPEELVRQNLLVYLINEKGYPPNLIRIEQQLEERGLYFRADVVVYDNRGKARMIIECKAAKVKITNAAAEQISKYNIHFKVDYLLLYNGNKSFAFKIDHSNKSFELLREMPDYEAIL